MTTKLDEAAWRSVPGVVVCVCVGGLCLVAELEFQIFSY